MNMAFSFNLDYLPFYGPEVIGNYQNCDCLSINPCVGLGSNTPPPPPTNLANAFFFKAVFHNILFVCHASIVHHL